MKTHNSLCPYSPYCRNQSTWAHPCLLSCSINFTYQQLSLSGNILGVIPCVLTQYLALCPDCNLPFLSSKTLRAKPNFLVIVLFLYGWRKYSIYLWKCTFAFNMLFLILLAKKILQGFIFPSVDFPCNYWEIAIAVFTNKSHSSTVKNVVSFPTKFNEWYCITYWVAICKKAPSAQELMQNHNLVADILCLLTKPK